MNEGVELTREETFRYRAMIRGCDLYGCGASELEATANLAMAINKGLIAHKKTIKEILERM